MASHSAGPTYSTKPKIAPRATIHAPNAPSAPMYAPYVPPTPAAPQPQDPGFELQKLQAGRNVALGNSESAYQTGNLGFDAGYNPDGSVNTANPYSRAAMYQLDYEHQQAGTTNSMANAGQLHSGAILNQRNTDASGYAQREAANRLAYQRGLHGIQAGQLSNYANNALGVGQGDFSALLKQEYPGT